MSEHNSDTNILMHTNYTNKPLIFFISIISINLYISIDILTCQTFIICYDLKMPKEITLKELKKAKWYLEHKKEIKAAKTLILIILNLILWGIIIYQLVSYLKGTKDYEKMLSELASQRIEILKIHQKNQPIELSILKEFIVKSGTKQDQVVLIENPNEGWFVKEFNYDSKLSFILPSSQKYLYLPNQTTNIILNNITWQRVRPEKKPLLEILPQIKIENPQIFYLELESNKRIPKISFSVDNQSIYNFWEFNLNIAIYKGKEVVGFKTIPLGKLKGGEKREIDFLWGESTEAPTHIDVKPDVNIFDPAVFMPY